MTTGWPGIEYFFTDHLIIHGSSLSIQTVKQSSPYGSTNGGIHTTDILPPAALKGFNHYLFKAKGLHYIKAVQFYKEFKVPWIFCWSYKISQHYCIADKFPMSLFREFKIKWWDKFNLTVCSESTVNEFLSTSKKIHQQIQQVSKRVDSSSTPKISSKAPIQLQCNSDSDSDNEFQQFLQFQKFKKMQKQFHRSQANSVSSSASTDPIGGQDPFEM